MFSDFCVFAQSQLLIKINRLTEELWKVDALNHRNWNIVSTVERNCRESCLCQTSNNFA